MSNARIQFSTASEEKWLQVNPVLREGELVIARKANGKRKLVVGKSGGSSYANSEVVWDAEQAETYMNTTKDLSENVNVFVPHIDSSGILTWTNKAGLDNPSPITIKGIKGDPGEKGEPGQRGEQGAQGIQGPRGIQGEQGERGVQGAQGPAGTAATITIGNVTTSAPGTAASVTNRGTPSAAVLDFVLPKGKDGADGGVTVDDTLSDTSTNPVQNKVVKAALDNRAVLDESNTFTSPNHFDDIYMADGLSSLKWYNGSPNFVVAFINSKKYTGEAATAKKATQDGDGNVITSTYATKTELSSCVKSVNNVTPDENGNVSISISGGGGGGPNITVDTELSATSTNPVQNKVIYNALLNKVGTDIFSGFALMGATSTIAWRQGSQAIGSINATNYTGTAARATQDGAGNVITETYATKADINGVVKSVNGTKPDSNGNVTITVSGGSNVTVDTTLSATSTNPIANKTVYSALGGKLGKTETAYAATKATQDGAGNVIATTYIKTVNNVKPDSNGNVNISGGTGGNITVDSVLSSTSTNAIQNKVVQQEFTSVRAAIPTKVSQLTNDSGYLTQHQSLDGYVKTVNNTAPDSNGNVTIALSGGGGVSTSESNTWTGKQTFQKMKFNFESYNAPRISGATDNPSESVAVYNVQSDFTLDMSVLAGLLSNGDATVFTAYITSNGAYTLSINNAGTLKYVGSASDLAITANGLLLNIMLIKSSSGVVSSVVQASKLA